MGWFKNFNTAKKIIILIGIAAFFLAGVGFTGYYYSQRISASMNTMYKENLLPVKWLNAARGQARAIEGAVLEFINPATGKVREQQILKEIEERVQENNKLLGDYEKTELDAFEKEHFAIAKDALTKWRTEFSKMIEMSAAGKKLEAYQHFEQQASQHNDKLNETLKKLADYNSDKADQANEEARKEAANTARIILGLSLAAVVITLILGIAIARLIANPLKEMLVEVQAVASGDLSMKTIELNSQDETGRLAAGINAMVESLRKLVKEVSQASEQVAASSEELTASAEQSSKAADSTAQITTAMAGGAVTQAGAVSDTAAIIEQMSASIQEVAATANNLAAMADQASAKTQSGLHTVEDAVTQISNVGKGAVEMSGAVHELEASSGQIAEIVGMISGIAGQTNLLALNAAIEAARAGEAGRGFAVVAEEVRKLAEQSEQAAHQIKELIEKNNESIQHTVSRMDQAKSEVETGVVKVNSAGKDFTEISRMVAELSSQIRDISTAVEEMAAGSQKIVHSVEDIQKVSQQTAGDTQNISAAAQEQSASMEEISASSQALAQLAGSLQEMVKHFRI